eukprot:4988231-Prymnesium_polylepis.1
MTRTRTARERWSNPRSRATIPPHASRAPCKRSTQRVPCANATLRTRERVERARTTPPTARRRGRCQESDDRRHVSETCAV